MVGGGECSINHDGFEGERRRRRCLMEGKRGGDVSDPWCSMAVVRALQCGGV
jgi:hypothetical protein